MTDKYLAENAPFLTCSGCGRKSWTGDVNAECGMTQPSGGKCKGRFYDLKGAIVAAACDFFQKKTELSGAYQQGLAIQSKKCCDLRAAMNAAEDVLDDLVAKHLKKKPLEDHAS